MGFCFPFFLGKLEARRFQQWYAEINPTKTRQSTETQSQQNKINQIVLFKNCLQENQCISTAISGMLLLFFFLESLKKGVFNGGGFRSIQRKLDDTQTIKVITRKPIKISQKTKQNNRAKHNKIFQHNSNTNNRVETKRSENPFPHTQFAAFNKQNTMNTPTPDNLTTFNDGVSPRVAQTQMRINTVNRHPAANQTYMMETTNMQPPSIPAISDITETTEVSTLTTQVPAMYLNFNTPSNIINVARVIRTELFRKYKYVRSKGDLEFSNNEHSVAQIVLDALNVSNKEAIQQLCWKQICYLVPKYLNNTRTVKLNAIKMKFNGKSKYCESVFDEIAKQH